MTDARRRQDAARLAALYRQMLRIRLFEEGASTAKERGLAIGPVHMSIGQEAVPVGVCANLNARDIITSTHRGHGHVLAKGADPKAMYSELFGRVGGTSGGKGGSMHIADVSAGIFGANGIVGAGIHIAVGAAHATRIRKEPKVVACFFGDGAMNRGPFLEGFNWAKLYALPVLFVCENNQFASTTRTETVTAGRGPVARAESLGVPAVEVDGNDVVAVDAAAGDLVSRIRSGEGPQFLHAKTYRLLSHTVGDARVYRTEAELAERWKLEPLGRCAAHLLEAGLTQAELDAMRSEAAAEMTKAAQTAEAAPWPAAADAFKDVQDAGGPTWRG